MAAARVVACSVAAVAASPRHSCVDSAASLRAPSNRNPLRARARTHACLPAEAAQLAEHFPEPDARAIARVKSLLRALELARLDSLQKSMLHKRGGGQRRCTCIAGMRAF